MFSVDLTSASLGVILTEIAKDDQDKVIDWLAQLAVTIETGVESVGPPSEYALVWEFGNARQTKKGPKTVKGINPNGEKVWLTIQAPRGWIAINEPKIWEAIIEEVSKIQFEEPGNVNVDYIKQELEKAYIRVAERALEFLHDTVPIDSGDLYDSLKVVQPNDEILQGLGESAESIMGTLEELGL